MTLRTKLAVVGAVLAAGTVAALCFRKPAADTQPPAQSATTLPLRDQSAVANAAAGVVASETPQGVPLPAASGSASATTVEKPLRSDLLDAAKSRLTPPQLPPAFKSALPNSTPAATKIAESPPLPDLRGNSREMLPIESAPRSAPATTSNVPRPLERTAVEAERPAPWRSHTVVDGDTLSTLATRYLGSSGRFAEILEANRNLLHNADMLPIGTVLRIPPPSAPVTSPASLPMEDAGRFPHLVPIPAGALTNRESSR